jgi:hypothetical protein
MQWNGSGDSLTLNAANAHISFSGWFSPGSVSNTRVINLGNLSAVQGNFSDAARLSESYSVDTFRIEAGKQFSMHSGVVLTMNQLIAKGTADDPISIYCVQEGNTASFSQSAGTVNAEYLELKDNTATGGAVFNAASSVDLGNVSGWTFTKEAQTISFDPLADKLVTDDPFTVSATATSGLPVSFSILTGPASIEGNTITLSGQPGTVTVQATQSGDIDYFAAQTVSQSFEVNKLTQSIDFPQIEDKYTTDDPFTVSATASSGLTVSFSILSGPATIAGNTITLTGEEGSVEVEASQLGDDTYEAVTLVNSFEVTNDPTVSVADRDAGSDIHLWPNPVSDRLYIDVYGLKDPTLSIIDISGKIISIERTLYQTPSGYYIDVTGLRKGIYFIRVGSEHYRKFVVKE